MELKTLAEERGLCGYSRLTRLQREDQGHDIIQRSIPFQ